MRTAATALLPLVLVLLLALSAAAQCTVQGVTFVPYGTGCNPVFQQAPTLSGSFDPSSCTVSLSIGAFSGCCNTFLVSRALAFGPSPDSLPLPGIGPGCTLLVQPAFVLELPSSAGSTFSFTLPPGIPPITVYVQGAVLYFTTIGLTYDLALTGGLAVSIA